MSCTCSRTCLKGAVVVGLIAALTPGLWAQPRAQERTTPDGQTIAPGVPAEAQRTPTARGSMLSDTVAPGIGTTAPPTAAAGGFLLDNGSNPNGSGRTVSGGNIAGGWTVFQPFTVPAPGWNVTTIGVDGWNVVDPLGLGMLGTLLPDDGSGVPDEANPIDSAVYHLAGDAFNSNWQDEPFNVPLAPGDYWMKWEDNGDAGHWSAIFNAPQGLNSFSRTDAGGIFPSGPTALRIAGQELGGLIWFFDQADFEAFNAGEGKVIKGIEDYEEAVLNPGEGIGVDDPLVSGVANPPVFPVGLTGLPNLQVQSNLGGGNPVNPNPRGADALAAWAAPGGNVLSDVIIANFFVDSLDLIFLTDGKTGVGGNTIRFSAPGTVEMRVYDINNNFLGMMASPADPAGTNFLGVWSPIPIGRINLFSPDNGAEGLDNIQAWEEGIPCPADLVVNGAVDVKDLLFLLGAWGLCPPGPPPGACPADFDNSGEVDVKDLLFLLGAWGPCPGGAECDNCDDGTVNSCQDNPECHDCITPTGECVCVQGGLCGGLELCPDGNCPPGFFCCVNTCCGEPVCLPLCTAGAAPFDSSPADRQIGGLRSSGGGAK